MFNSNRMVFKNSFWLNILSKSSISLLTLKSVISKIFRFLIIDVLWNLVFSHELSWLYILFFPLSDCGTLLPYGFNACSVLQLTHRPCMNGLPWLSPLRPCSSQVDFLSFIECTNLLPLWTLYILLFSPLGLILLKHPLLYLTKSFICKSCFLRKAFF